MKNNLLTIILISGLISLTAGGAAAFLFNSYFNFDGSPLNFGRELNLNSYGYMSPSFIIQEPRKVVVNQDLKVDETITNLKSSLFGVYLKSSNLNEPYDLNQPFAQALAVSTDGWLMIAWPELISENQGEDLADEYIVINNSQKIYEVEQAMVAPSATGTFVFFKLKDTSGLNVRRLLSDSEIRLGQSILLSSGNTFSLDYLSGKRSKNSVFSSDIYPYNFILNSGLVRGPAFAFNLSGDIIGALDLNGRWLTSMEMDAYWRSLFVLKKITRASLGINYINLSDFIYNDDRPKKGALIESFVQLNPLEKNPAVLAGLKIGDIITKINGIEINSDNNLSSLINNYNPGDKIFIHYLRDGNEVEIEITLSSIK